MLSQAVRVSGRQFFIFYDDGSTYASFYRTICTFHMLYVDVLMYLFSTPIGYFANPLNDLCISSGIKNAGERILST